MRVAIVGGGYAGMAAAVTLAKRRIPVTVFESAKQLGGRARGVVSQGTQLDNGQHILLGCYRETLRLIGQVGGTPESDFLRLPLQLTLHNRFELKAPRLPAPLHLLAGLFRANGIGLKQRLNAVRFMNRMRWHRFELAEDCTAADLLAHYGQDEALTRLLWEPICISALNTPLEHASAQVLLNVLRDALNGSRSDSDMLLPTLDFTALFPQRAAEFVRERGGAVETSCSIERIDAHDNSFELSTAQGVHHFSHVICAASAANASRLLRKIPALIGTAGQIDRITYQPIYTVYLQYRPAVRLPHPMLGLDGCLGQWLFDKGRIAGQDGLIAVVISAEGVHQNLTHPRLAERIIQELREQFGIAELPLWHQVIAEKRATFACVPDMQRPDNLTPLPGLLLAGDYTAGDYPATLEGAVRSGIRSAELILNGEAAR
jgi:squalene-associated FAD-dependent desaturase